MFDVKDIIAHGNSVTKNVASETMDEVHKLMKIR